MLQHDEKGLAAIRQTITACYPGWTTLHVSSAVQWHGCVAFSGMGALSGHSIPFAPSPPGRLWPYAGLSSGTELIWINTPACSAAGPRAIPDLGYWSAAPWLPIAMCWMWHRGWEQTGGWGMGECVSPVAAPQHSEDKSQFHLTKSLTTK